MQPDSFIPLVEENGLILPIGEWVLRTACQQLAAWALDPETAALKLSVNVSTRQFQSPAFVEKLLALLQSSSANPRLLILELTESLLVEDVEEVVARMVVLQRHGISFSLDDFGTGYSSLSYLKLMPLNQLKIDRSFVRDLLTDPNDEAIARTIITLADALGLNVLAEGVETIEQRTFLEEAGCHAFQGYLFSRPLPIAAFHAFLQSQANLAADR